VAEAVIAAPRNRIKEDSIDATVWRTGARILGFLLSVLILIRGMQLLGADLAMAGVLRCSVLTTYPAPAIVLSKANPGAQGGLDFLSVRRP
jgi:hypothetical protein